MGLGYSNPTDTRDEPEWDLIDNEELEGLRDQAQDVMTDCAYDSYQRGLAEAAYGRVQAELERRQRRAGLSLEEESE